VKALFITTAGATLFAISVSCTNGGSHQFSVVRQLPESGVIHKKILCTGNPARSYALYIPAMATKKTPSQSRPASPPVSHQKTIETTTRRLFPCMLVFDPHGDGELPLTKYKELAEKYGMILAGSNDSRNGLPAEDIRDIVVTLVNEVRTIYPVDTNRIYLMGFSGGARVATAAAMYYTPVTGVIGCGAGFGGTEQPVRFKFDYYGMVGTADFNMHEMLRLEVPLSSAGVRHFIATFPGAHGWPPFPIMDDGFCWITINAMKDNVLKKDSGFISGVRREFGHRLIDLIANKKFLAASEVCRQAISFLDGLETTGDFSMKLHELEQSREYQSQLCYRLKTINKEEEEKQYLINALQAKDLKWWKAKISEYDRVKKEADAEDTLKDKRVLAFLSLYCYMNANSTIKQNNENAAVKIIAIYEMADPANPEPNYMRAVLLARRMESEAALGQMKIAVKKGFSEKKRLTLQPEFSSIISSPGWNDLLKSMK
jgi:predicted esterase